MARIELYHTSLVVTTDVPYQPRNESEMLSILIVPYLNLGQVHVPNQQLRVVDHAPPL